MKILQPPDWPRPKGYANGVSTRGQLVFVSGIVGWDQQGQFAAMDFAGQVEQALRNIVAILKEADALPQHIVRMTWYVLEKSDYLNSTREIGASYRNIIGKHYPAMSVVQVAGLVEENARVEIEVTAVIPEA
jgi:enamine deaminase RidA (YjgF/YER057c/UK114 family)